MNEENQEKGAPVKPNKEDWFLQTLVNMANNSDYGLSIGITIITHGFLVSGKLISGKAYFEGFGNDFRLKFNDPDNETANGIADAFKKIGVDHYNINNANSSTENTIYIHLENAQFFHPGALPVPGDNGVWWRGRLSEISGFSLGALTANTD